MIEATSQPIGWDPGRPNGLHHPLMHPTTPRNDATTTENIRFPIPPPKPCASMRAQEDEVKAALGRPPITCGWDPGKDDDEDSLSDCETALACDDGSTFADDFAVAGGISGNGVPTPPGTTPTTARAFADPGTGHGDDAVCADDEDPD